MPYELAWLLMVSSGFTAAAFVKTGDAPPERPPGFRLPRPQFVFSKKRGARVVVSGKSSPPPRKEAPADA